MKIALKGPQELILSEFGSSEFLVEQGSPELRFAAIEMFIASVGFCMAAVLDAYGRQIEAGIGRLALRMEWEFANNPFRVTSISTRIHWPEVPEERLPAARRAAEMCTLHHTLMLPPELRTHATRIDIDDRSIRSRLASVSGSNMSSM